MPSGLNKVGYVFVFVAKINIVILLSFEQDIKLFMIDIVEMCRYFLIWCNEYYNKL